MTNFTQLYTKSAKCVLDDLAPDISLRFFMDGDRMVILPCVTGTLRDDLAVTFSPAEFQKLGLRDSEDFVESLPEPIHWLRSEGEGASLSKIEAIKRLRRLSGEAVAQLWDATAALEVLRDRIRDLEGDKANLTSDVNQWKADYEHVVCTLISPSNLSVWQVTKWIDVEVRIEGGFNVIARENTKAKLILAYDVSQSDRPRRARIMLDGGAAFYPISNDELDALPRHGDLWGMDEAVRLI